MCNKNTRKGCDSRDDNYSNDDDNNNNNNYNFFPLFSVLIPIIMEKIEKYHIMQVCVLQINFRQ